MEDPRPLRLLSLDSDFRFNVQQGLEQVALEEWKEIDRTKVATQEYTGEQCSQIQACASQLRNLTDPSLPAKPAFNVPFERDNDFVGREDVIKKIDIQFRTYRRRVALCGLGGIGKSQIAIEYAYRFRQQHRQVLWVHAANKSRFDQAYQSIAEKLKIPGFDKPGVDTCQLVYKWLNDEDHGHWLMILDNADDMEQFFPKAVLDTSSDGSNLISGLASYIPQSSRGSILITTRNRDLGGLLAGNRPIEIECLTPYDAEILLRSKVPEGCWDTADASKLVEALGCLPLAITQSAAYVSNYNVSLKEYLAVVEDNDLNLKVLSKELQDPRRELGSPNSVFRTWMLSFNQIRGQNPKAAQILSLMALLDRQGVPKSLLRKEDDRGAESTAAFGTLQAFSLVTAETGGETLMMHRLVQLSTQNWLEKEGTHVVYREEAVKMLSAKYPNGSVETWKTCETLLPHAQAVLKYSNTTDSSRLDRADLLYKVAGYNLLQGRYEIAHTYSMECYEIRRMLLERNDLKYLACLRLLGRVFLGKESFQAAEDIFRETLLEYEKVLGKECDETLECQTYLAYAFEKQGKYEPAAKIYQQVLEAREKRLGTKHPDTLSSINSLARLFSEQGKHDAAEEWFRRALNGFEEVLGELHPRTLIVAGNLAQSLENQGNFDDASSLYQRAGACSKEYLAALNEDALNSKDRSFDIQSLPGLTAGSTLDSASPVHEQVLEAAEEFAALLLNGETLNQLFTIALKRIGTSRFGRNIAKLLKGFADGLRKEASSDLEHGAVELVRTSVQYIVSRLRRELDPNPEIFVISKGMDDLSTQNPHMQQRVEKIIRSKRSSTSLNPNLPQGNRNKYVCLWPGCTTTSKRRYDLERHQKTHHMSAQLYYCHVAGCERGVGGTGFRRADKLLEHVRAKHAGGSEKFLQAQSFIPHSSLTKANSLPTQRLTSLDEELNDDDDDMDGDESEPAEPQIPRITNFARVKAFMVNSTAFVKLREDVRLFVFPLPATPLNQPDAKLSPPLDDAKLPLPMDDTRVIKPEVRRKESAVAPDTVIIAADRLPGTSLLKQALFTIRSFAISVAIAVLYEKPLRTGFERVRWTCSCGQEFHQDFLETSSHAQALYCALCASGYQACLVRKKTETESRAQSSSAIPSEGSSSGGQVSLSHRVPSEPQNRASHQPHAQSKRPDLGVASSTAHPDNPKRRWLLLCFDFHKYVGKVIHVDVQQRYNDTEIFHQFRREYFQAKGIFKRHCSWRTVKKVSFVQFQLALDTRTNDDIPLIDKEWNPPRQWTQSGQWEPRPQETRPKIPEHWLLHHWYHPHDALGFRLICKVKIMFQRFLRISIMRTKALCGSKADQLPSHNNSFELQASNEIMVVSCTSANGRSKRDGNMIFEACPKKLLGKLLGDPNDPPYGWGLYLKEGFEIPEFLRTFGLFLLFCGVFGILFYCAKEFGKVGFNVFSLWSSVIALLAFTTTLLFKYVDARD